MSDSGTVRLPATLRLLQLRCIEAHKAAHLYYFYTQNPGRTLIFCNAISVVQSLTDLLNMLKVPAFPLHGKMQQRQRLKNLDRFVADANGVIVATDVAARGLDVRSLPSHRPRDATTRAARARARSRAPLSLLHAFFSFVHGAGPSPRPRRTLPCSDGSVDVRPPEWAHGARRSQGHRARSPRAGGDRPLPRHLRRSVLHVFCLLYSFRFLLIFCSPTDSATLAQRWGRTATRRGEAR